MLNGLDLKQIYNNNNNNNNNNNFSYDRITTRSQF